MRGVSRRRVVDSKRGSKGGISGIRILYLAVLICLAWWMYMVLKSRSTQPAISSTTPVTVINIPVLPPEDVAQHIVAVVDTVDIAKERRRQIAYAITLTKDGFFQDGAAVLAYSIYNVSRNVDFDITLLAFVHPNVTQARPLLIKMGFHVIVAPTPIYPPAIRYEFLRTKIDKNGCCGSAELIKLNSYRLLEYDYGKNCMCFCVYESNRFVVCLFFVLVVHLDADTYLLNPIDELFDRTNPVSLTYTTDPNMATHKGIDKMPVQGVTQT